MFIKREAKARAEQEQMMVQGIPPEGMPPQETPPQEAPPQ
jgi:hypothetical protein